MIGDELKGIHVIRIDGWYGIKRRRAFRDKQERGKKITFRPSDLDWCNRSPIFSANFIGF